MILTIEYDREEDGRWIAELKDLPGCMVVEASKAEALAKVAALAFRVLADRLEHGEAVSFVTKEPQEPGELGAKSMLTNWGARYVLYWKAEEPKLSAALVKKGVLYRHALRCQEAAADEFANRIEAGWNPADARIESLAELLEDPLNPKESENLNLEEEDDPTS